VSHFSRRAFNNIIKTAANAIKSSHTDAGYMTLIVQLKDRGDGAFLTLTADKIYAMGCAEEGMPKIVFSPPYIHLNSCVSRHSNGACICISERG
jgi:hypothetical protein